MRVSYDDKAAKITVTLQWALEQATDGVYIREYHDHGYDRFGPFLPLDAERLLTARKSEVARNLRDEFEDRVL